MSASQLFVLALSLVFFAGGFDSIAFAQEQQAGAGADANANAASSQAAPQKEGRRLRFGKRLSRLRRFGKKKDNAASPQQTPSGGAPQAQ